MTAEAWLEQLDGLLERAKGMELAVRARLCERVGAEERAALGAGLRHAVGMRQALWKMIDAAQRRE